MLTIVDIRHEYASDEVLMTSKFISVCDFNNFYTMKLSMYNYKC